MKDQINKFRADKFTLSGRMFYPSLPPGQPKIKKSGRAVYDILFAWTMGSRPEIQSQIESKIEAGIQQFMPNIPREHLILPIKTWGQYAKKNGQPVQEFLRDCHWMNMSTGTDYPPQIVDVAGSPVNNPIEIYSGRNVAVSFSFFPFSGESYGVSVNLEAIMLLEGGEKEVGGVNINEAFASFMNDSNQGAAANPFAGQNFAQPQQPMQPQQPAQPQWGGQPQQPAQPMQPQQPTQPQWGGQPQQPAQPAQPPQQPQWGAQPQQPPQQPAQPAPAPNNPWNQNGWGNNGGGLV